MPDPIRTDVSSTLPHTGTARLLTNVVRSSAGFIEATGQVPATHPLVGGGCAPCFLGLELGAQAAAALEAIDRAALTGDRSPRIGQLVRVREAAFLQPTLPVATPLSVTATLDGAAPPLAIYRIRVSIGGVEYMHAILSTHVGAGQATVERSQ